MRLNEVTVAHESSREVKGAYARLREVMGGYGSLHEVTRDKVRLRKGTSYTRAHTDGRVFFEIRLKNF